MTYSTFEYDSRLEDGEPSAAKELAAYIEAKEELATLTARVKLQGEVVYEILSCEPDNKLEFGDFGFSLQHRAKWEFSDNVKEATEALSDLKKHEKSKGIAKEVDGTSYPVMKRLT